MPTYLYRCDDCSTKYTVFHKVREVKEDVVCPECGSQYSKKLITAANIGKVSSSIPSYADMPSCATGSCCAGGDCGLN